MVNRHIKLDLCSRDPDVNVTSAKVLVKPAS